MAYGEEVEARAPARVVSDTVSCPSGLRGRIRKLTLREMQRVADSKSVRSGEAFEAALRDCWVETLEFGPAYGADFSWESALQGDRMHALLMLRAYTFGAELRFQPQCPAQGCRKRFEWALDVTELPVRRYPEESLAKYRAGEDFEGALTGVDGRRRLVRYRLATGHTERALRRIFEDPREEKDRSVAVLANRMVRVEGLEDERGNPLRTEIRKWVREGLPGDEVLRFGDMLDEVEGGVDTTLLVRCPHCGEEFKVELPFVSEAFWAPSRRQRQSG